jgi:hypothetical protein
MEEREEQKLFIYNSGGTFIAVYAPDQRSAYFDAVKTRPPTSVLEKMEQKDFHECPPERGVVAFQTGLN